MKNRMSQEYIEIEFELSELASVVEAANKLINDLNKQTLICDEIIDFNLNKYSIYELYEFHEYCEKLIASFSEILLWNIDKRRWFLSWQVNDEKLVDLLLLLFVCYDKIGTLTTEVMIKLQHCLCLIKAKINLKQMKLKRQKRRTLKYVEY